MDSVNSSPASFEIKSGRLELEALVVRDPDLARVAHDFEARFGKGSDNADFFDHHALVIDLTAIGADASPTQLTALIKAMKKCRVVPIALKGASAECQDKARTAGLAHIAPEAWRQPVAAERPVAQASAPLPPTVTPASPVPTLVVDKPLRSGQKVYARGGDLVVMAMVNPGAEVVADGHIHVYAPLRGKAMAGARGNTAARIFSLCLEPELVSVAGLYRTSEHPLPDAVRAKPAQVRLSPDGQDRLLIEALPL
ncbi:MAG: septum site-determining protein MinC [Rhodoferax sp.]|nr:septum site-determining protein MinC [Rhodoferax sp.]